MGVGRGEGEREGETERERESVCLCVCVCVCVHACVCDGFNDKVIFLALQYLEVISSIDFNYFQFNKCSSVISSSLDHSRQFGERSKPVL